MTKREAMQADALSRAQNGQSFGNWPAILSGFMAKGIDEAEILPRENIFTYNAWKAAGRQVRRGEHGVQIVTYIATDSPKGCTCKLCREGVPDRCAHRGRRPRAATVFHVTQTDPIGAS